MSTDTEAEMLAFNDAINGRDIDRLAELMTETHRFIDAEGGTISGRDACLAAWQVDTWRVTDVETSDQ